MRDGFISRLAINRKLGAAILGGTIVALFAASGWGATLATLKTDPIVTTACLYADEGVLAASSTDGSAGKRVFRTPDIRHRVLHQR
jgi:hypothetical protein